MKRIGIRKWMAATFMVGFTLMGQAQAIELDETIWSRAATPGIDPHLLYAVALVESRTLIGQGKSAPRPYVIRVSKTVHNFDDYVEAKRALERFVIEEADNLKRIDVGMLQINVGWHQHRVDSPADFLIPGIAIKTASEILQEAMSSTRNLVVGVGRYHSYTVLKDLSKPDHQDQCFLLHSSMLVARVAYAARAEPSSPAACIPAERAV